MGEVAIKSEIIEVADDIEAVYKEFYGRKWIDGLPIIPPTPERVRNMMKYTDRESDDIVGVIPPMNGEATVEKIAINAVMAGCIPGFLPVIITAVEAMVEKEFNLYGILTTTHPVSPLIIVNGPVRKELDINSGYNLFGPGWRANATIGRAINLICMNIGGAVPGLGDKATHGHPGKYTYCIAEYEEANPWEPLHVERGFERDVSTVTVVGGEGPHNINDHSSIDAAGILTTAADTMATLGGNNTWYSNLSEPLLILSPEHAETVARDGFSKMDVKNYIFNHARNPIYKLKDRGMYKMRVWPRWFDSTDDHAMIPICPRAEDIMVIVAGGPGKQSMCVPTFGETLSVTKPISLSDGTPIKSVYDFRK
jgi:hypothetical protein